MDRVPERTFVLDAIRANRRRVFLAVLLFFLIALIVAFLATLFISLEDMRWKVEMLLILAISVGITLLAFPTLYYLGLRSSRDVLTRLFPPAILGDGDPSAMVRLFSCRDPEEPGSSGRRTRSATDKEPAGCNRGHREDRHLEIAQFVVGRVVS